MKERGDEETGKKKKKKKKDYYMVKGGIEIERKERQRNREAEIERPP